MSNFSGERDKKGEEWWGASEHQSDRYDAGGKYTSWTADELLASYAITGGQIKKESIDCIYRKDFTNNGMLRISLEQPRPVPKLHFYHVYTVIIF